MMQAVVMNQEVGRPMMRPVRPSEKVKRWLYLFVGIGCILIFVFRIAPWLAERPAIKPMVEFVEKSGIDASALYYTEVEESGDAGTHMRNTMAYPPKGP